jgi:hypothetical protein
VTRAWDMRERALGCGLRTTLSGRGLSLTCYAIAYASSAIDKKRM